MKVIFLDFDGVLNNDSPEMEHSLELWAVSWLEPAMVARLATLVDRTAAKVVVTSSWRQRRSKEELDGILAGCGFSEGILDVTPKLPRSPEGERLAREREIMAWLEVHPEVLSFVILDDKDEFQMLASSLVHVDSTAGLSDADVTRAQAILLGA
jgi:hypothetical protein